MQITVWQRSQQVSEAITGRPEKYIRTQKPKSAGRLSPPTEMDRDTKQWLDRDMAENKELYEAFAATPDEEESE